MKKLIVLFIIGTILVSSCKKECLSPSEELSSKVPAKTSIGPSVEPWGKFLLIDATMWVENKETGVKTKYNHFSSTKTSSCLEYGVSSSGFDIDIIEKNITTYSFWKPVSGNNGIGKFVLNNDTTKHYGVNYIGVHTTIIEDPTHNESNMGGSSRPFSGITIDYNNGIVGITIGEREGSINGENCHYFTELTFKKIESW